MKPVYRRPQQGLTLVELMIALTLGLVVIAVVVAVFFSSNQNYRQNEAIATVQDNARFALDSITRDLAMAGYWGGLRPVDAQVNLKVSALASAVVVGCDPNTGGPATTPFDVTAPLHFVNQDQTSLPGCLDSTNVQPNSDIVVIRRVSGVAAYDSSNPGVGGVTVGRFYVKTNQSFGALFQATSTQLGSSVNVSGPLDCPDANGISDSCKPVDAPVQVYAYTPQIYYVRKWLRIPPGAGLPNGDGLPILCRRYLDDTVSAPVMREDCLAEGVENLQIEWGLSSAGNQNVLRYTSTPSDDNALYDARTARITLLVRAVATNVQVSNDLKTFTLGDLKNFVPTPQTGVLRRSFTTTVQLKNFAPS